MTLSRLSNKCKKCPFVEKCKCKKIEALACISKPMAPYTSEDSAQSILRETVNTIIDGKVAKVYKDEIEEQLYKSLHHSLNLTMRGRK